MKHHDTGYSLATGRLGTLAALGVVLCLVAGGQPPTPTSLPAMPDLRAADRPVYEVLAASSGTGLRVRLDGDPTEVRLIGVYVPSGAPTDAAEAFLHRLLRGERVWLATEPGWPEHDAEGRRWVYACRDPDGLLVNLELVRQGYARVATGSPFAQEEIFRAYEDLARRLGKGLWSGEATPIPRSSTTTPSTAPATRPAEQREAGDDMLVYITAHGKKYHRQDCQYVRTGGTPISLHDAKARGYTPCSRCKPPP